MPQTYVAKKNDCMESIAKRFGFGDYKVIYDHPQNAQLKQKRQLPNLLVAGDKVFIPDIELREESCSTEQKHTFEVKRKKVKLRIVVKDDQGNHIADKKYELTIGKQLFEGDTDGSGFIEQEIPADATTGKLKVFTEDDRMKILTWDLSIGALEPVDTDLGVQSRLKNLAFYFGTLDGKLDEDKCESAVQSYKTKNNMEANGEVNDEVRNKLRDSHDKKS